MTFRIARRAEVEPFHAMDVLAQANRLRAAGADIVSMAVGQPGDPAPAAVRAAAAAALAAGPIGYTDALGMAPLRARIAEHYRNHYGVAVGPERIAVTTGSSAGFILAFLAMFEPGERVALTVPGYPAYRNILKSLGLQQAEIRLADTPYLTAEALEAAHRATPLAGVLFASPANPTGAVVPEAELDRLLRTARSLGIAVISDEIYHRLAYEAPDVTALAFDPDTVVINSFSKYYCMTGWRIGWMVLPEALVRPVERLAQSLYISAPELSQIAAMAAFDATSELEAVKRRYAENRALLAADLPRLGFDIAAPMDGAFYAYCDISRLSNDSMAFARRMLAEAGVAATPGHDFDPSEGARTMRFSYAGGTEEMREGLSRLAKWLGGRAGGNSDGA